VLKWHYWSGKYAIQLISWQTFAAGRVCMCVAAQLHISVGGAEMHTFVRPLGAFRAELIALMEVNCAQPLPRRSPGLCACSSERGIQFAARR
jgi:hypothetical protein